MLDASGVVIAGRRSSSIDLKILKNVQSAAEVLIPNDTWPEDSNILVIPGLPCDSAGICSDQMTSHPALRPRLSNF
jgi:hypothetical protein